MGDAFEYIIRRFNEAANETSGDHYTPRDAIKLLVDLLFADARFYGSEQTRRATLPTWMHLYNHHRTHSAINGTPISWLNHLPGHHS